MVLPFAWWGLQEFALLPATWVQVPIDDPTDDDSIIGELDVIPDATAYEFYSNPTSMAGDPVANGTLFQDSAAVTFDDNVGGPQVTRFYTGRGKDGFGGFSDFAPELSATSVSRVPGAPTSLIATEDEAGSEIDMTWAAGSPANQTLFRIQERNRACGGSFGAWTNAGTVGPAVFAFSVPTLEGFEYQVRVRAENDGGNSAYTTSGTITASVTPGTPSGLTAVKDGSNPTSQINVAWTKSEVGTNDDVEIHRSTTGVGGVYTLRATQVYTDETYSDTGLADDTEFCYKVRQVNDCGDQGGFAGGVCATTDLAAPTSPPANITIVPKQATDDEMTVDFDAVPDATSYEIWMALSTMGADPTVGGTKFGTEPANDNPIDINVNTLISAGADDQVFVNVRGKNAGGNGPFGTEANGHTHVETPQNFVATQDSGACPTLEFDLTWDNLNTDSDVRSETMTIERDDGSGFNVLSSTVTAGDTTFTDSTAVAGTVAYRIKYNSETAYATDNVVSPTCPE